MEGFDWRQLPVVAEARDPGTAAEVARQALTALAGLLSDTNHGCSFELRRAPLLDGPAATLDRALLPSGCRTRSLRLVTDWAGELRRRLPAMFVPPAQGGFWSREQDTPAHVLADGLARWAIAALEQVLPPHGPAWEPDVVCEGWYEAAWFDLMVQRQDEIWFLHLGVSD